MSRKEEIMEDEIYLSEDDCQYYPSKGDNTFYTEKYVRDTEIKKSKFNDLLDAVILYKKARDKVYSCPELILSSGSTDEAKRIMKECENAREHMFWVAGI